MLFALLLIQKKIFITVTYWFYPKVRKEDLPKELREQRPIKAKTKLSMFSALSEGEATDLAWELGAMLGRHVNLGTTASVSSAEADIAK